jgi:glutathione S-transferase
MRKLWFTTGSPFARAVRIVLAENGLGFQLDETSTTPSVEERSPSQPEIAGADGDLRLWDSTFIIECLMTTYPNQRAPSGQRPFAMEYVREDYHSADRLTHETLETFGTTNFTIYVAAMVRR